MGLALKHAGYETIEATGGRAALALLANAEPDLIITDMVMPEMDGVELIMTLRKIRPKLPVIAMSGGGRVGPESYLRIARAGGAAKSLTKPFETPELLAAVQELIGPAAHTDQTAG